MCRAIFFWAMLLAALSVAAPELAAGEPGKSGRATATERSDENLTATLWLQARKLRRDLFDRPAERTAGLRDGPEVAELPKRGREDKFAATPVTIRTATF